MHFLVIIFLVLSCGLPLNAAVNEFTTDGCTLAPDGTWSRPTLWHECCVAHDLWYWGGGTKSDRMATDHHLKQCIEAKAGKTIATLFSLGVNLGSLSPFKIKNKKWGNAWKTTNKYFELSPQHKKELLLKINFYTQYPHVINQYKTFLNIDLLAQ